MTHKAIYCDKYSNEQVIDTAAHLINYGYLGGDAKRMYDGKWMFNGPCVTTRTREIRSYIHDDAIWEDVKTRCKKANLRFNILPMKVVVELCGIVLREKLKIPQKSIG